MSSSIHPSSANLGDQVKVILLDDTSISYSGKVIGTVSYSVAKSLGTDLAARHEQIRASIISAGGEDIADVSDQQFLLIDTGDALPLVAAFDWISGKTVELVELGSTYTIKLLNCSKEKASEAISILRANNISCKLNTTY